MEGLKVWSHRCVAAAINVASTGLRRDFVQGAGSVAIAGLAVAVYLCGQQGGASWAGVFGLAIAGTMISQWWKLGLTGELLTPAEAAADLLATGLLAASASSMAVLQAPTAWSDLLRLCSSVAACVVLVYHAANAYQLATTRRHLGGVVGGILVATPYLGGSLLMLGSPALLQGLARYGTFGTVQSSTGMAAVLGRTAVLLVFNVLAANGIALVARRGLVKSTLTYGGLAAVALAAAAASLVADFGSSAMVAGWPSAVRAAAGVAATVVSQAGLWAEVYLITGMILDALAGAGPGKGSAWGHPVAGLKRGMIYSGTFMGIVYGLDMVGRVSAVQGLVVRYPLIAGLVCGAVVFPLVKTIVESFDGSPAFVSRLRQSYRRPILYTRGALLGAGLAYALGHALSGQETGARARFGFVLGAAALAGVNLARDGWYARQRRGQVQSWRVYLVESLLGGFIGAAIGFYLDGTQVALVVAKFHRYLGAGQTPEPYGVYPLLSKWGFIDLGQVAGGVKLLFAEALAGVINWSIPAWLFAINWTVMEACFRRESAPIRSLFTSEGLKRLAQNMIEVLRWGLWMSPIISTFLRPVGDPTWYNQDGALRTVLAIVRDATMTPDAFRAWSLQMFVYLLAYDTVRVLIWLDHMGLRVATLVNLSFLGMDKLDQRLARFLGSAATARCIPEGIKRFTTWAPLLLPFYIPRGQDWDHAWSQAEALHQRASSGGPMSTLLGLPWYGQLWVVTAAVAASTALFAIARRLRTQRQSTRTETWSLANPEYEVVLDAAGQMFSHARRRGYDVSRRSYDRLDPAGRALFVVDPSVKPGQPGRVWPVIGHFPKPAHQTPIVEQRDGSLCIESVCNGLRTTIEVTLPDPHAAAELWTIRVENLGQSNRMAHVVPYLEWVLNRPEADRGHTQYNRLFTELEYHESLQGILAWDKHSKAAGILASDVDPDGFLTSRVDFIGRARRLAQARALETLAFPDAEDTTAHPTFDPIGSLLLSVNLKPRQSRQIRVLIGMTEDKEAAAELAANYLGVRGHLRNEEKLLSPLPSNERGEKDTSPRHSIGHGEIPSGATPYFEWSADGRTLRVRTPFTPRPYDHTMSNALGHVVSVTNRGLHTSSSVNSQQNRLTPDWADIVTREVPGEAFYLYDPDRRQWFSPTYHPLNDAEASHEVDFSVDGSATYRMTSGTLATELVVFVPPDEPTGVYLLTVKNHDDVARRLRLAPYFQIVLAAQPEHAGPLSSQFAQQHNALLFENPRNRFRSGPAFVAMSLPVECVETTRGGFFGPACDVSRPAMVEQGRRDGRSTDDDRPVAAMLATLEIPAHGERTVAVVLGQAGDGRQAQAVVRKYADPHAARASLERTRQWWLRLMNTVRVATSQPRFGEYLDWLKYQALAERIWARRGFYQASGAFGFRDQLQDSVNLMWVDPTLARRQIVLHAAQQFVEGDVVHWFHHLQDGRTGFAARTHASDNLLWLPWAVVEYVGATGDYTILDEQTPYLEAEQPFTPLPAGKHGMGFDPLRSARSDTVYQHCLHAIDLVLDHRMGEHGLPLIGTGDWNDGLDEIGSQGRGESIWLGFFLVSILDRMAGVVAAKEGGVRQAYYVRRTQEVKDALEGMWRGDRYLRAIHDDGTEIGVAGSGVWEIDALTAAWAVIAGVNPERGRIVFDTAIRVLEKETTILLGWPSLSEDTKPYLGRSSRYPAGVRENGMYCHGVQWLVGAARILAEQCRRAGQREMARRYRETAYRLWRKISALDHVTPGQIETYGGQPNKQAADMLTTFDPGRMIWHGYTGAAGWMLRQALEGVVGARLVENQPVLPSDLAQAVGELSVERIHRDVTGSPLSSAVGLRPEEEEVGSRPTTRAA
jgi:cyclic beta-1,2-glucan synthetase